MCRRWLRRRERRKIRRMLKKLRPVGLRIARELAGEQSPVLLWPFRHELERMRKGKQL